jgi:hypothetical protein
MAIIIVGPDAPQPPPKETSTVPALRRSYEDPLDRKLVEVVGQPDNQPVSLWAVIHEIISGEHPADRTQRRRLVGRTLCRAQVLLRRGILVREDKAHVRLVDPVTPPLPPPSKPVKNLPPASYPTVADMGMGHPGGESRRVYRV